MLPSPRTHALFFKWLAIELFRGKGKAIRLFLKKNKQQQLSFSSPDWNVLRLKSEGKLFQQRNNSLLMSLPPVRLHSLQRLVLCVQLRVVRAVLCSESSNGINTSGLIFHNKRNTFKLHTKSLKISFMLYFYIFRASKINHYIFLQDFLSFNHFIIIFF